MRRATTWVYGKDNLLSKTEFPLNPVGRVSNVPLTAEFTTVRPDLVASPFRSQMCGESRLVHRRIRAISFALPPSDIPFARHAGLRSIMPVDRELANAILN